SIAEITKQRHSPMHMRGVTGAAESPQPRKQIPFQLWLDIEWAFRIQHPLQTLEPHSGSRKRDAVTRHDHSCIAVRASRANVVLLKKGDVPAFSRQIVCGANTHYSAANDNRV